jgi:dihydroorotate dehydrogenase
MDFFEISKKILFQCDPEFIHHETLNLLKQFPGVTSYVIPGKSKKTYPQMGKNISWNFPMGVAAGLDKNGEALEYWDKLGFGAIEIGTVTLKPQLGNPKPRMFRYPAHGLIRNAMGFPGLGMNQVLENLKSFKSKPHQIKIGVNIGKNKDSDFGQSLLEYQTLYNNFAPHADYIVINLSSPNTKDLRQYQQAVFLKEILSSIKQTTPLFLKLSPDESSYEEIIEIANKYKIAGLVCFNTTTQHDLGAGGLSGEILLKQNKTHYLNVMKLCKDTNLDLILCGGFSSSETIKPYYDLGQKFFQTYTGLIYHGPKILKEIENTLM